MAPDKLDALVGVVEAHAANLPRQWSDADRAATAARVAEHAQVERAAAGGAVAVLPLIGSIFNRANIITDNSGGVVLTDVAARFRALVADPAVSAIVLDVDSPGGVVDGVEEFAAEVLAAREVKTVVAVADTLMASAAYWIASGAAEIVATPSATVGSIGVYALHTDESRADEQAGLKRTLIYAGRHKTAGNPHEPLADDARGLMQQLVDETYAKFVAAVAKGRDTTPAAVRGGYGEGFVLHAEQARAAGMVDRVGTLQETIARLSGPRVRTRFGPRGRASATARGLAALIGIRSCSSAGP